MINQSLYQDVARSMTRDKERAIAAAELRRQAKAAGQADGSSVRADRAVASWLPPGSATAPVIRAWRWLSQVLDVVVRQRRPA